MNHVGSFKIIYKVKLRISGYVFIQLILFMQLIVNIYDAYVKLILQYF